MNRFREFYNRRSAVLLAAAALIVMLVTLFGGGMIGLSDNGDFVRVMRAQNLDRIIIDRAFVFIPEYKISLEGATTGEKLRDLLISTQNLWLYPSIHQLFVRVAVIAAFGVQWLTGPVGVFSVAYLGVLYSVIYALLLWGLFSSFRLKRIWADLPVKLCVIAVLCDVGYVAYFNSLYSEPVQILALLAMVVCLLRILGGKSAGKWYSLFCLAALIFGWAKFANIPVAAAAVAGVGIPLLGTKKLKRRGMLIVPAVVSLAVLAGVISVVPAWMSLETDYNAVFYGALKDVDPATAQRYADELDLSDYVGLAGTHSYVKRVADVRNSQEFQDSFHVGKLQMTLFYLRHPARFFRELTVSIHSAGFVRPYYLANYDSSHPRLTLTDRFSGWTALRQATAFDEWWLNLCVFGVSVLLLFAALKERGLRWPLILSLMLAAALAYDLASPILSNGEADLAKHMFSFVQVIDLLVLFDLIAALELLLRKQSRLPALLSLALIAALLLVPAGETALRSYRARQAHDAPEPGSYVVLGQRDGEAILWLVTGSEGGALTLMAAEPVAERQFSGENSNLWSESELREWLNGEFTEAFSPGELDLLLPVQNRFVLSQENEALAEDGDSDFYAFHTPREAFRGEADAVGAYAEDTVFLPDLTTVCRVLNGGGRAASCWLETPYYSNGQMVRILAPDGYLYMRDAKETYPVVPCVTVAGSPVSGSGSATDPFILE